MRAIVTILVLLLVAACEPVDFQDTDGRGYRYEDLQGKWLVINYWATWCAPCIREIPELIRLGENHDDVLVFGVNYDQPDEAEADEQIDRMKITFPVFRDDPYERFDVDRPVVLPTTFVIDPSGKLANVLTGPQTEETLLIAMGLIEVP